MIFYFIILVLWYKLKIKFFIFGLMIKNKIVNNYFWIGLESFPFNHGILHVLACTHVVKFDECNEYVYLSYIIWESEVLKI